MKTKTTFKAIRDNYSKILSIGYCQAQSLLVFKNARYYNSGVYGWNCDFYVINDIVICTGYKTIGKHIDSDLVKEYNNKAYSIYRESGLKLSEVEERVNSLLLDLINESTK